MRSGERTTRTWSNETTGSDNKEQLRADLRADLRVVPVLDGRMKELSKKLRRSSQLVSAVPGGEVLPSAARGCTDDLAVRPGRPNREGAEGCGGGQESGFV